MDYMNHQIDPSSEYMLSMSCLHSQWPLNDYEENCMTTATIHRPSISTSSSTSSTTSIMSSCADSVSSNPTSIYSQAAEELPHGLGWRSVKQYRSTVLRCDTCQRRFHSLGNLANHQQLYLH
ncbi:uncharacterized protein BYT42DRAFT_586283 [Radiomyces spectabilis]|uniref:uncharacterized protein n=1 Tax=Radiomyces spectabilis TaxID=64574 RepID=UPI00221E503A|nr:uncharacterized protein BYT42DRAFT_586283 [Radiomyces spectabilis]KAI8367455.1 hypothetical protein BYT42DRAFT_586283 [Radiomyces spectabilis]